MQLTQKIGLNCRTLPLSIGFQWILIALLVVIGLTGPLQKVMAQSPVPDGTYTEQAYLGGTTIKGGKVTFVVKAGTVSILNAFYPTTPITIAADSSFHAANSFPNPFDPKLPDGYERIDGQFKLGTDGAVIAVIGGNSSSFQDAYGYYYPTWLQFSGPLLSSTLHGIDTDHAPEDFLISTFYKDNYGLDLDFVIAKAWGGRQQGPVPDIFDAVPTNFRKAAFMLLDFNRSTLNGTAQADQAFNALQGEAVSFMAVDVENTHYKDGVSNLPFSIEHSFFIPAPNGSPPNPITKPLSIDQARVRQRITEAIQELLNKGIRPIIYSRNNANNQWLNITGNSTAFSNFPLWDARSTNKNPDIAIHDDSLLQDAGGNWITYGGWSQRDARQYVLDDTRSGDKVDLDVATTSLFDDPFTHPPTAQDVTNLVTIAPKDARLSFGAGPVTLTLFLTVTNKSKQSIAGPLEIADFKLPPGVVVLNPSNTIKVAPYINGIPYICWQTVDGLLHHGDSVDIPVVLALPSSTPPTFHEKDYSVYSGYF